MTPESLRSTPETHSGLRAGDATVDNIFAPRPAICIVARLRGNGKPRKLGTSLSCQIGFDGVCLASIQAGHAAPARS